MSMINITNGLTRADDDIDLSSFYSILDGISFLESKYKDITAFIEAFNKALDEILNDLSITSNADLEDKLLKALTGTFGLALTLRQRNAFHQLFALCNLNIDINFDIKFIFKRFVLSFILTGCHPKVTFRSSFEAHAEAEINIKIGEIASLNAELDTTINSSILVVSALNDLRNATIELDTNAYANANVQISGDKNHIASLTTEINDLTEQRYRVNGVDEDISYYDDLIKIKEDERTHYINLLEQHYINIVDVAIKDLVDALALRKKQYQIALATARNGNEAKRILFNIEKKEAELKQLKDDRNRLFTVVALDVVNNLNKGVQDITAPQFNGFITNVISTPVVHSLKRTDFLHRVGKVYDKTLDKQTTQSLLNQQTVNDNINGYPTYNENSYGTKPIYFTDITSKTDSPVNHSMIKPFTVYEDTVVNLFDKFEIQTKQIHKLRESNVLATGLLAYAKRMNRLEFAF